MHLPNFNYHTLPLQDDYEGKVIATLTEAKSNTGSRPAVLYLHGFIDYFFQTHLAEAILSAGYDFYALELRKCGHSLLPHQHPNYCRHIEEYFEETSVAIQYIFDKSGKPITLLGHSTGGLIAALYMHKGDKRELVDKLILNSPFLEFNIRPRVLRAFGKLIARPLASVLPYSNLKGVVTPIYPKSIHKNYNGEWDFDLTLKPIQGFPAYFAWIHAVDMAQKELRRQADIKVPILILHSDRSFIPSKSSDSVHEADIVLDVKDITSIGSRLGKDVTLQAVANAKHDVFLSTKPAREKAFALLINWLKK
jgi:alpha-beta hydrolase superfamily lysophospholipase